jgi:hypothetical protein
MTEVCDYFRVDQAKKLTAKSFKQFYNLFPSIVDKNTLKTLKNISRNQIGQVVSL